MDVVLISPLGYTLSTVFCPATHLNTFYEAIYNFLMRNSFLTFKKFLLLIPKEYLNPLSSIHEKILVILPPNLHHLVKRYISGKLFCIQIFSENHRFQSIPLPPPLNLPVPQIYTDRGSEDAIKCSCLEMNP